MILERVSAGTARVLALFFFLTTVALGAGLLGFWWFVSGLTLQAAEKIEEPDPIHVQEAEPVSPLLVEHSLELPGRGEVFPALMIGEAADYWPVAVLTISNKSDKPVMETVRHEMPGWSRPEEQTFVIGPRETRVVRIVPDLLPEAYSLHEIRRVRLNVHAENVTTGSDFSQSKQVYLHSGSDLYWGKRFANAQYVARWVTPHDPSVLRLVSDARKYAPRHRLAGYPTSGGQKQVEAQVRAQAEAVFKALKDTNIGYVSSIFTFTEHIGRAQRIRLPHETLAVQSANCIDVSVLFASAMENLGMRPVVVIVPGHAFVGVYLGRDSSEILYLDLTVLPDGSFQRAISRAQHWLKKTKPEQITLVDIAAARMLRIYPLPTQQTVIRAAAPQAEPESDSGNRPKSH